MVLAPLLVQPVLPTQATAAAVTIFLQALLRLAVQAALERFLSAIQARSRQQLQLQALRQSRRAAVIVFILGLRQDQLRFK